MTKKIDLSKYLMYGSAKQRAALHIYHRTVLDAIEQGQENLKPILTDREARALINSFKTSHDREVYDKCQRLNNRIIIGVERLYLLGLQLERDRLQFLYESENIKGINDPGERLRHLLLAESSLLRSYNAFFNFYSALKIYTKDCSYSNKYILDSIEACFESIHKNHGVYPVFMDGVAVHRCFSDIEVDLTAVDKLLLEKFNHSCFHNSQLD
ncbi:hypothetical protein [Rufibacter psychrotolerans]|uniref:hypothetical protein n=1 Tax=Rufibacter psychrotolerans TaxID=2812556 RepID=UPI0019680D4E|nr:hypothetical protein [Rufibacter sp. SYSU D00308]